MAKSSPEEPQKKIHIYDGPTGETVFDSALWALIGPPNELPQLFRKTEGLKDDRLIALVSALLVEDRLDKVLSAFFPRYDLLKHNEKFTFSLKLATLEALNLIPKRVLEACNIVRLIRNNFAHQLEITKLSEMDKKVLNKVHGLVQRLFKDYDQDIEKRFNIVSFVAIGGLDNYAVSIKELRTEIESPKFMENLRRSHREQCAARILEATKNGPTSYRKDGDTWVYVYGDYISINSYEPPEVYLPKQGDFFHVLSGLGGPKNRAREIPPTKNNPS